MCSSASRFQGEHADQCQPQQSQDVFHLLVGREVCTGLLLQPGRKGSFQGTRICREFSAHVGHP